jgi:hypothetical protein
VTLQPIRDELSTLTLSKSSSLRSRYWFFRNSAEQVSSVAKRTKLAECLAFMRDGDVLTVTKPDRLARSTAEVLAIEADLSKRGIGLAILSMGGERLDTRNPTSKLMLTILAGVATWNARSCWSGSGRASPRRRRPGNTRAAPSASTRRRSGN